MRTKDFFTSELGEVIFSAYEVFTKIGRRHEIVTREIEKKKAGLGYSWEWSDEDSREIEYLEDRLNELNRKAKRIATATDGLFSTIDEKDDFMKHLKRELNHCVRAYKYA